MNAAATKQSWDNLRVEQDCIALLQGEMTRLGIGALYLNGGVTLRHALNLTVPGARVFVPVQGEPIAELIGPIRWTSASSDRLD